MGTLKNLKTGQTYTVAPKEEDETEQRTGGTLTDLSSGRTYTAPAKAETKEAATLPMVETDPIKSAASALKTVLPHASTPIQTLQNLQTVTTGGTLPVIAGLDNSKYQQLAKDKAAEQLDQLKTKLDTAKTAEQKAIQAANQYVTDNQGWLDMPDRQSQLQTLNDAATKATQEREALEKQYYSTNGSFEHETKDFSNAEKAFMGILASPFRAVDVVAQTAKSAIGGDNTMDMSTLPMQRYQRTQQLKSDATKDLSGAGKLLADAGISVAQNLYALPLNAIVPNASLAAMAVDAAAGKMVDVGNSGGSAANALVRGGISGGIEAATELVSLKSLNNLVKTGVASVLKKTGAELTQSTARTALLNILNQAKSEAMEEGASYALNYISDKLFKDPDAKWDWKELLSGMAAGGISGLFFGLGGTAVNAAGNVSTLPMAERTTEPTTLPMVEQQNQKLNIDNAVSEQYNNLNEGGMNNGTQLHGTSGTGVRAGQGRAAVDFRVQNSTWENGQGNLRNSGIVLLSPKSQQTLSQRGVVNVELHDSSADNAAFSSALDAARNADTRNGWAVTPKTVDMLTELRSYMDENGTTGFAIAPDGDIEAVFANKAAGAPKGVTKSTIPQAIAAGGTKLDCYGDNLVNIYKDYGFIPVARTLFDPEQANKGWTPDKGTPDIYFMMHNGDSADTVVENYGKYKVWTKAELDALPVMEYDDAYAYRDSLMRGKQQSDNVSMSAEGNPTRTSGVDQNAKFLPGSELDNAQRGTQKAAEELPMVDGYGRNTVGSAQAQFEYREAPTQSVADRMFTEQEMQNHDLESRHQVYSNAQSRADAELMLDTDYEGEVERLRTEEWGPAENVEGHMILENLVEQARKTGTDEDWAKVTEWKRLYDRKGGTEAGQTLQSRAQFADSAATITAEASDFLDSDKAKKLKGSKRQQVMETVAEQSEALENIPEGDTDALIGLIERNSEIRRTTGLFNRKTSRQMDWALHKVAEISPDADSFLRGVAASQTRGIYEDYAKTSLTEKAKSIRIMNMLSKPSTIMRNLVSNNIFDPLETLSNDAGLVADLIMSKATGQRTTALEKGWVSKAKRHGSVEGALKSFIEVGLDADSEYSSGKYEGTSGRTFKMTGNFLERLLSTWSKYQSYTLTTTDEFQKGGIRAEAQESIDKLKQSGKLDADSLNEWADETAKQRTFQNDSIPADLMIKTREALNTVHAGDIGAGDILVPFARVPGNLVAQAANYSPVGIANGVRQMAQVIYDAKHGNYSAEAQAQAARNVGRGLTGTGLLAGFTALAAKGLIDVAGADDDDKEALEKAQGRNGTQWNLSATLRAFKGESTEWQDGDTLMSIGFLDPINSIMAAGAMIADAYKEDGTLTAEEVIDASLSSLIQSVLDLPAMSSINDLITTAEYAQGETAGEKFVDAAKDYAAGELESFVVPNALRGIATGMDDTVRNRYTGETFKDSVMEGVASGVPGARNTLPASLDPFGREKTQTGSTVMNMLNNNLLPGALTKYKETAVERELETVYDAAGNASVYPDKKAPNSFEIDGEKFTLDAQQKDEFMTASGETAYEIMLDLIGSEDYQTMNAETKSQYLAVANEYARAVAKVEVSGGKYELTGTNKKIAAAEEAGMSAADYIMYKLNSAAYNEDGEGSMTIGENAKAIRNSGMSRKEQEAYWLVTYPEWPEKAKEKGVDISDYINYKVAVYGVEGDKNAAGKTISGSKKKNMIAALVAAGYSQAEARKLYEAMNTND